MKKTLSILLVAICIGATSCGSQKSTVVDTTTQASSTALQSTSNVITKIDNLLDLYEQYIGKYITAYKKLRSGDALTQAAAIAETTQLLQNANSVGEQLNGLKDQMTQPQVTRWGTLAAQLGQAVKDFQAAGK